MHEWCVTEHDHELFARDLESFVPSSVFDAHAHWYCADHFPAGDAPPLVQAGPSVAGDAAYRCAMELLLPSRTMEGLFFGYPHARVDVDAANAFVHDQLRHRSGSRGEWMITPRQDPEWIRDSVRQYGFVGLKCYHLFAACDATFDARIEEYLPESQMRVADEEGLVITLHLVRSQALADEANQDTLRRYSEWFPDAKLILAHAARGFNPHHTMRGVHALRGLSNIWFDVSAITDSGAIEAIALAFGHERVLYGSDFPVSHQRGRCVAVGNSFLWISAESVRLETPYGKLELALVGHDALRTLKVAAMSLRWTDSQIEDIFSGNARRLLGLGSA